MKNLEYSKINFSLFFVLILLIVTRKEKYLNNRIDYFYFATISIFHQEKDFKKRTKVISYQSSENLISFERSRLVNPYSTDARPINRENSRRQRTSTTLPTFLRLLVAWHLLFPFKRITTVYLATPFRSAPANPFGLYVNTSN